MPGMVFMVGVPCEEHEKQLRHPQELNDYVPMEKVLDELLGKLNVENVVWCRDKLGQYYQVTFFVEAGDPCETCLHCLTEVGIGNKFNLLVNVVPCSVFYNGRCNRSSDTCSVAEMFQKKKWKNFVQSIRSKLTVKQVVDGVRSGAECTFDYILLLLIADMIAALGLVENNSVNIVAAMLVSPLMGPIMAITFGTIISDRKLIKIGIRSEVVGLLFSILFGFIFGLLIGCTQSPWGNGNWPTEEMTNRGSYRSLWTGILWAIPSGAGVALALLQGSAGPLIGVAISASILPPAVNCGIMWALACVSLANEDYLISQINCEILSQTNLTLPNINDTPKTLVIMGILSFCVTLINIVCIFIAAVVVLKIKEVAAPYTSSPDLHRFWQQDIRMARSTNQTETDCQMLSDLNEMSPEKLDTTLDAAVREALVDPTFCKIKRVSYPKNSSDIIQNLGIKCIEQPQSSVIAPATCVIDPVALEHLLLTLTGEKKSAQKLTRAHTLSRSVRLKPVHSHACNIRNSLFISKSQLSPTYNQSCAESFNNDLSTIIESTNSMTDNKIPPSERNSGNVQDNSSSSINSMESTTITLYSDC